MLKRLTFLIISLLFAAGLFGQTSLEGKVTDQVTGDPILFGTVAIYKNGTLVTGTETDLDGNYVFSNLDPGSYDVEASYVGYQTIRVEGVIVKAGQININNINVSEGVTMQEVVVIGYKEPLIDFDNTTQGGTVTADEIRSLPTKNITAIAATTAGISTVDGGDVSIRGSREDGTYYYVDGVRVSGSNIQNFVPQSEIDQMQVITGGIESKYGDVTGGIISITTKGPSESFSGGFELETSQFLDPYGYNLAMGNISGPILKNKDNKSVLGFRLSGQYIRREDDNPSAVGVYRASEEIINDLILNPVQNFNGTPLPTAEFLTAEQIGEPLDAAPGESDTDFNINGKVDARISDNIDVTLSGSYFNSSNQFTPFSSTSRVEERNSRWSLLNWTNNPFTDSNGYRGNFRFRHKIGKQGFSNKDEEDAGVIRNASYTLQVGYEKTNNQVDDTRHGENLFNYGYYGTQPVDYVPTVAEVSDTTAWLEQGGEIVINPFTGQAFAHQGYNAVESEFIPNSEINPAYSRFNTINGMPNVNLHNIWSDLFFNVGRPYNRFFKEELDRYTINAESGFDLVPGGSERGKHNIQFGFTYEQRINRRWEMTPEALWTVARSQANIHIQGVNPNDSIGTFIDPLSGIEFTQYSPFTQEEGFPDSRFFKSVRELQGLELTDYVNVDQLTPDQLTLDMFSPGELINEQDLNLNYYGYDYLGNKLETGVTFDDFFTGVDASGVRTFNVAPLQPIYAAGYLQDKFKYKDIIIRLGVRLDYYDANTKVLKDPYALYDIQTADEFFAATGQSQPESVDNDYKVYVSGEGSESVVGFRDGDNWFGPDGTSVSGGQVLFGGGLVFPSYVNGVEEREINSREFDPSISFNDYTPQLNVMPRIAFSFPITEDAGFFAHYDVLVQRPPTNTGGTALDYYFFEVPSRFGTSTVPANNPDLKPEKTVDYEVGFQSKISNTSAIKISAYYKEMRDMIQRFFYTNVPAPLNTYQTFRNVDFGTVKGFSFSYDLRRTGNIQLNASYTLQFADGSGSDANSSRGLNSRGTIKTLFPLSFDERHAVTATIDYRFGDGKQYNGPRIGNTDIFSNAGINVLLRTVSGRPYSQYSSTQEPLGQSGLETINEARLPWIFNADLRIDKSFKLNLSEENNRNLNFNVYLRFENLFNTRNIIDVFGATGSAEDDGYLQSSFGQDRLNDVESLGKNVESFLAAYYARVSRPDNYTRPRRIYLGLVFDF